MSTAIHPPAAGDFDDFEFGLIVADFDEPERPARQRPQQWVSEREAIAEGLGFRRHRSRERGE